MLEKHKNLDKYRNNWSDIFNKNKEKEEVNSKPKKKKNKLAYVPIEKSKVY